MSQLSSIETAELQKQHGTSHVQMSGIRVLWVPLPTERVHPSWSHATALISKILYMIPFTAAKFSDHSSGGLLGHFSGLSAKWHPWMQWLCVPSFLQKIIRKTFPLLHVNVRIKHKLTFISKPLFFFLLQKWLAVYLLQNSNSETQFISVCGGAWRCWDERSYRSEKNIFFIRNIWQCHWESFLETAMVDASSLITTNMPPSKFAFRNTSFPNLGISLEEKIQMWSIWQASQVWSSYIFKVITLKSSVHIS